MEEMRAELQQEKKLKKKAKARKEKKGARGYLAADKS